MTEEVGAVLDFHFRVLYHAKVIDWLDTGGPDRHRKYTLNELYSALQELFDDPAQMDCLVPMKAFSRHVYRLENGWDITLEAIKHLKLTRRPKYDWLLYENGVHVEGRSA